MKKKFHLDKSNAKLMGVCAGIANYFDVDANTVRILWVIATLLGVGVLIPIYIVIGLVAN